MIEAETSCSAAIVERDDAGNEFEYEIDVRGCATVVSCTARAERVSVPERLGGVPVTRIGDEAFASSAPFADGRKAGHPDPASIAAFAAGRPAARNASLRRVELPEGVVAIGRGAFRGCARLSAVRLPTTLVEIADYAFSCTDVRSIELPRSCVRLAPQALRTGPEALPGIRSYYRSKLERIDVHPDNDAFCMCGGVLCRRVGGCVGLEALLCPGTAEDVDLSCGIGRVLPSTFAGTGRVGQLTVGRDTEFADDAGLLPNGLCKRLEVHYADERGRTRALSLRLPTDASLARKLFNATRQAGRVDAARLASAFDEALADVKDPLEQSTLMLERLAEPLFMTPEAKRSFTELLQARFDALCLHFGARGRWECFDLMADAGLIDAQACDRAVDVLSQAGDGAAVRHVLELKHRRFEQAGWDYGI